MHMSMVPLPEIEAAAQRIKGHVRRTPFLRARHLREPLRPAGALGQVLLKLENLQVSGSFKARGASNAALCLPAEDLARGVITASGGNHGAAVAYAGATAGTTAVVYVPAATAADKIARIRRWGAEVVAVGEVWDDAQQAALERADRDGLTYIHPFADEPVMAGQGTVALEMLKQSPDCALFVIAVGGGGLIAGMASAIKQARPSARVIGVEPVGAPTLSRSLQAGEPVTLDGIDTRASSLAPRASTRRNLDIIAAGVDEIVLVDDAAMADSARWLWLEMGLSVELSAAAALAALRTDLVPGGNDGDVGVLVCGAGVDGISAAG
jgi:threonine dehydratase